MKLVIDRKRWMRGEGSGYLFDSETKKMCCLGFDLRAGGMRADAIRDYGCPSSVASKPSFPESSLWLVEQKTTDNGTYTVESRDGLQLMELNDKKELSESERESGIAAIFAKHGVEVEFIN
jgi:hypothetical protein